MTYYDETDDLMDRGSRTYSAEEAARIERLLAEDDERQARRAAAQQVESPFAGDRSIRAQLDEEADRIYAEGGTRDRVMANAFDKLVAAGMAGDQRVVVDLDNPRNR